MDTIVLSQPRAGIKNMGIIDDTTTISTTALPPSAWTLPSSTALRLQHLSRRIHTLGRGPLFYMLGELAARSSAVIDLAETYAALTRHSEFLADNGVRDLNLWLVPPPDEG